MTNDRFARRKTNHTTRISLSVKLLAAFGLVVVVAALVVALVAGRAASHEFTEFMLHDQAVDLSDVAAQLAAHYARQGDWSGVEPVFAQQDYVGMMDHHTMPPLLLVDQGRVIASNWQLQVGDRMSQHDMMHAWPIKVAGETVGALVVAGEVQPHMEMTQQQLSPEGAETVERVQHAILIAGIVAGAVALVIAGMLAWGLVRPLRRLTAAAEGIARGDLSQRVSVSSSDEVGELAATFNLMARELERAERLRRNMTADVAHELRTPLSVIRGKLEGVLDGVYPATPEHLEPVLEATELLTYLVEDLRLLAQAEAGQLALARQAVDVGDLLRDAHVNFEPQASDRDVTLALDLPSKLPQVMADWHRIAQVLGNLLTNALRHTPKGGRVTLSAVSPLPGQAGRGLVKVTVTDTGAGIPPEDLSQVFDRFWRGEKSRSRAGGGTGLGLAIVKQLVELHGGTIGVESTPGAGSEFWFELPVAQVWTT